MVLPDDDEEVTEMTRPDRDRSELILVRPSTEVGPEGLTDEQIEEMTREVVDALYADEQKTR